MSNPVEVHVETHGRPSKPRVRAGDVNLATEVELDLIKGRVQAIEKRIDVTSAKHPEAWSIDEPDFNTDLIQQRLGQDNESTTGILLVNRDLRAHKRGEVVCYLLEDGPTPDPFGAKVPGRTRIPAGVFPLERVRHSGILDSMRRWFPELPWIVGITGIPGFQLVRYHTGVKHEHTDGCPLTAGSALNSWKTSSEEATLADTRLCYKALHYEVFEPMFDANPEPRVWVRDEGYLLR